jgi:hypothetical protein
MAKTLGFICSIALALSMAAASAAPAASLQPVGSFEEPIYVTSDPGNPERLFVVERAGKIIEVNGGATATFADLSSVVSCCEGERGLLSIALAPDFDSSGLLYVDYTGKAEGEIRVAELRAAGKEAPLFSLRNVLKIPHPGQSNHNGGQLQFGPEGNLFISTGDGGGANDELKNAQDLTKLLGKILRIDPRQNGLLPYTAPAGNPFPAAAGDAKTIWSYGLRNPFRFSFDRLSGALVIGDVGQNAREEIDYAPAPGLGVGADYGWNCREGLLAGPATDPQCATPPVAGFVNPVFDYPHFGGSCSGAIIGGYVERDPSVTDLNGRYVYGDACDGDIRSIDLSAANPAVTDRAEGLHVENLDSFGEDSCGRLYVVSRDGAVQRFVGSTPASCSVPGLTPAAPKKFSFIGLRAVSRKIERNRRAAMVAWVSPCEGRRGDRVRLRRGSQTIVDRSLNRACTAHFLVRVGHNTKFHATIAENSTYQEAFSKQVKIRVVRRQHNRPR